MTLIELYQSQGADGKQGKTSRALLTQTHWFTINADFDPKTGEALPQALSTFLAKLGQPKPNARIQDRLFRITEHARPAVERLFRALNESPRREHALLPVRAVRELDAGSFIKLSTRPGRNIREKLAGKPYLQAVRRFQSVNLPENRLLKVYVSRLAELLKVRCNCLGEAEDELLVRIQSWLRSEEANAIGGWDNLPPNNALLSHRDYGCVWDAWRRLQTLDDDIARDLSRLECRGDTMRRWTEYARMYREGTHRFAEMPVLFDYDNFTIRTWVPEPPCQKVTRRIGRSVRSYGSAEPVCIDLADMHPRFAITATGTQTLTESYLWQQWKNDQETVDIDLLNSDALYLSPDATSIASSDLFFARDKAPDHLDRSARTFATKLRAAFKNDTLIWLVPDFLNDFDLQITRRNINARFPKAQPLPRSVAAVFERVDYAKTSTDGHSIVIVDTIGGQACVTKLIARFDPALRRRLPETNGCYWERCPPVVISRRAVESAEDKERQHYDIITVDGEGHWRDPVRPEEPPLMDLRTLRSDQRIGQYESCITLTNTPVAGGIRLYALQQRAGDIPLWRDQIPELTIKVMKDGRYQRFHLVSRGTTVKPIRGLSVPIPVCEHFVLSAGRPWYQFPLYQGENADEIGFSARLDSPAFPLKQQTECKLNLTFEYGADEPYSLMFAPIDKSFPAVRANWRRTVEEIFTDAPAPEYPTPMSWADLRSVPKPGSERTSDLLEWVLSAIEHLDRDVFVRPGKRVVGTICAEWRQDRNGNNFTFAKCVENGASVFIHERHFLEGVDFQEFGKGDDISFELQEGVDSRVAGRRVAASQFEEQAHLRHFCHETTSELVRNIRRRLYVPIIQTWKDGRSTADKQCPPAFAKAAEEKIAYLADLVVMELPQPIRCELLFLLACLHKDTVDECIQWITGQVESGDIRDPRAVGFALGDVSEEWQQYVFSSLASRPNTSAISVFAYAIWREEHFVERFSTSELQSLLNCLLQRLSNIRPLKRKGEGEQDKWAIRDWVRTIAEPLELLLGLLRTRVSADPQIKLLLQPHQKITRGLAEQIDRVEEIIAESSINLFSRVQLHIQKPEHVLTPDLLYALRLFLTGDDGANAIHIASISDNDDD